MAPTQATGSSPSVPGVTGSDQLSWGGNTLHSAVRREHTVHNALIENREISLCGLQCT